MPTQETLEFEDDAKQEETDYGTVLGTRGETAGTDEEGQRIEHHRDFRIGDSGEGGEGRNKVAARSTASGTVTHKIVFIYTLADPRTSAVRYVGQTLNPNLRIAHHTAVKAKANAARAQWIDELIALGLSPVANIVQIVYGGKKEANVIEAETIKRLAVNGANLTNVQHNRVKPPKPPKPVKMPSIKTERVKEYVETRSPNQAASALARIRWDKATQEEKSANGRRASLVAAQKRLKPIGAFLCTCGRGDAMERHPTTCPRGRAIRRRNKFATAPNSPTATEPPAPAQTLQDGHE